MGLFLGVDVVPALFVAVVLGSLVGLAMMLRQGPQPESALFPLGRSWRSVGSSGCSPVAR
jgi:hypothetical protein